MSFLERLGVIDFRAQCPRANWSIGFRHSPPQGAVFHYHQDRPLPEFGNPQAERRRMIEAARYHINKNWAKPPRYQGGDGLMYHLVVLSNGDILQTRDLEACLWHCGTGKNITHLAIHVPMGGGQTPTTVQWQRCCALFDALIADYGWPGRKAILGHREEGTSECPGDILMDLLLDYRRGSPVASVEPDTSFAGYYTPRWRAILRQAPVMDPRNVVRMLPPGERIGIGAVVRGQRINGDDRWGWVASGEGFVHFQSLKQAS